MGLTTLRIYKPICPAAIPSSSLSLPPPPEYMINVKCYTFGAPRPGNHAFARMYDEAVPDTWHLVNNDDVITKAGKVSGGGAGRAGRRVGRRMGGC